MSELIIPKPGSIYSEFLALGSDDNYYVKLNGVWVKAGGKEENITPIDPRAQIYLPAAQKGDKFFVVEKGTIQGIALEKGDMLVCINDTTEGNRDAFVVLQANINIDNFTIGQLSYNSRNVPIQTIEDLASTAIIEQGKEIVRVMNAGEGAELIMPSLKNTGTNPNGAVRTIVIHNKSNIAILLKGYIGDFYQDTINGETSAQLMSDSYIKMIGYQVNQFNGRWEYLEF